MAPLGISVFGFRVSTKNAFVVIWFVCELATLQDMQPTIPGDLTTGKEIP